MTVGLLVDCRISSWPKDFHSFRNPFSSSIYRSNKSPRLRNTLTNSMSIMPNSDAWWDGGSSGILQMNIAWEHTIADCTVGHTISSIFISELASKWKPFKGSIIHIIRNLVLEQDGKWLLLCFTRFCFVQSSRSSKSEFPIFQLSRKTLSSKKIVVHVDRVHK